MDNEEVIVINNKLSKKKIIIIVLAIIIGVVIISTLIFLLVFKQNKEINLEDNLLNIGKEYYEEEKLLPTAIGECKNITLEELLSKNRISNPSLYSECNKYNSYVKVCKLENKDYHYTPILSCDSINSEEQYTDWVDGNDVSVTDDFDVRFLFLGYEKINNSNEELLEAWEDELENVDYEVISSTTYYRYRDKEWLWQETTNEYYNANDVGNVVAYYAEIPDSNYLNSDSQTTAYKWYKNITINKELQKVYICKSLDSNDTISILNKSCSNRLDNYTIIEKEYYTCGVKDINNEYIEVPNNTICDCSESKYGDNCEVKKSYYPSNSSEANQEFVYYKEKPVEGAIKDVTTRVDETFRYYKEVVKTTDKYYSSRPSQTAIKVGEGRFKDWTEYSLIKPKEYSTREIETRIKVQYELTSDNSYKKVSEDYQTIDELIRKLQSLNYEVETLSDIKNNNDLKYELKLQYRKKNK